jgi:glycosyltransferase involved in cell wall biosynthesis
VIDTSFSVIIPTLDRPGSLARAIASVAAQSRPIDEIIIVDSGSTPPVDPEHFTNVSVPLQVVRSDHTLGVAAARNLGVARASGTFVAFLDDDDTWTPAKLEFVEACLTERPDTDVVIHATSYHLPSGPVPNGCTPVGDPLFRMIRTQPPHLDGVVVRRSVHAVRGFDESMSAAEDLDYLIRLARSGAMISESTAVFALHGIGTPSAISIDERIAGRMALLDRHPEILADSRARSFFYVRLGHLHRRGGRPGQASQHFARAIVARPVSPLPWKGLARVTLRR